MIRYLLPLLWLISSCKTVSSSSAPQSLQSVAGRILLAPAVFDVSKDEALTIVVDAVTDRPHVDARLFLREVTIKIADENDDAKPCTRAPTTVSSRGERGEMPFTLSVHHEGTPAYQYTREISNLPVHVSDVVINFEKDATKAANCKISMKGNGHWAAPEDQGYRSVSDNPGRDRAIRDYSAAHEHRVNHYLWHSTRGMWGSLLQNLASLKEDLKNNAAESSVTQEDIADAEAAIEEYRKIGWEPPRYLRDSDRETADSGAGEDFLYMHHRMLKRVADHLKSKGFDMIPPFETIPAPDDPNFPLVAPGRNLPASGNKSDDFYYLQVRTWEKAYRSNTVNEEDLAKDLMAAYAQRVPKKEITLEEAKTRVHQILEPESGFVFKGVKGSTLSEYGHILEMTIHNSLHMRFAYQGAARPSSADPLDHTSWNSGWAPAFDTTSYDWLGDTYSAHVHPWFYRIHGWVEARLQTWLDANGYKSIGLDSECSYQPQPCYVWLSHATYKNTGAKVPWDGPIAAEAALSLHDSHEAPILSKRTIKTTKGFRAQHSFMDRIWQNAALEKVK